MKKISSQEEFVSAALGIEAKLWIEQSARPTTNASTTAAADAGGGEMLRLQFRAFRPALLDILPSYAAGDTAWPPTPVAATIFLSPDGEGVEAARCKRILVTRHGSGGECKDLLGFVPGRDSDVDGLVIVHLEQIEEKAKATSAPAGVELLVSTETSSSVTGLVD